MMWSITRMSYMRKSDSRRSESKSRSRSIYLMLHVAMIGSTPVLYRLAASPVQRMDWNWGSMVF